MTWIFALVALYVLHILNAVALDPISVSGGRFRSTVTGREFRPVGLTYDKTNGSAIDSLSDPSSCLRDAALLQQLGVNAISVEELDANADHDLCMSIFNSVGIYVAISVQAAFDYADLATAYGVPDSSDLMYYVLSIVEAFKRYENVLLFEIVGAEYENTTTTSFASQQPYMRAMVRDVKQYMTQHSQYPDVPVGMYFDLVRWGAAPSAAFLSNTVYYATCQVDGSEADSAVDFVSMFVWDELFTRDSDGPAAGVDSGLEGWQYGQTIAEMTRTPTIPLLFWPYRNFQHIDRETVNNSDSFDITNTIYQAPEVVRLFAGGFASEWANEENVVDEIGIAEVDALGNMRLLTAYGNFSAALSELDLDDLRAGAISDEIELDPYWDGSCNTASFSTASSAVTPTGILASSLNSSWALPTQPPSVASMISNGVDARAGTLVDFSMTAITQTVRDARRSIITSLAITPAPSQARGATFVRSNDTTAPSMSLGAKIGVGVGAPIAVGLLVALGYLLWRRRRRLRMSKGIPAVELPPNEDAQPNELSSNDVQELPGKHQLYEVPTKEQVHNASTPLAELPADSVDEKSDIERMSPDGTTVEESRNTRANEDRKV